MPIYSFICEKCNFEFDEILAMSKRKTPTKCKCKSCNAKSVISKMSNISIFSDSTLTANKKTKGDWNRLTDKIKKGIPKRYHSNLDQASSRTGRRFMG